MLRLHHIVRNAPDTFVENAKIVASTTNPAMNAPARVQINPVPANCPPAIRHRGDQKAQKISIKENDALNAKLMKANNKAQTMKDSSSTVTAKLSNDAK